VIPAILVVLLVKEKNQLSVLGVLILKFSKMDYALIYTCVIKAAKLALGKINFYFKKICVIINFY